MNALKNHWKLFVAFLLIGLFTSFGLRAAGGADDDTTKPTSAEPRRDQDKQESGG